MNNINYNGQPNNFAFNGQNNNMMGNMNMYQNNNTVAAIPGRPINNLSELKPNDVPMDGSPRYFPQVDGSCIYVKFWNNNCELQTVKYVRVNKDGKIDPEPEDPVKTMTKRIENLETLMASMLRGAEEGKNNVVDSKASDITNYYANKEGQNG